MTSTALRFTTKATELLGAIGHGVHVGGGTAWLWASLDAVEAVDVLFIDEAAQMALANVLAVSQAAPQSCCSVIRSSSISQCRAAILKAPTSHALDHILGDDQTIAD